MIHKVLVTGFSGFIGKEVSEFFLSQNYKVYGLDKVKSKNTNSRRRVFKYGFNCSIIDNYVCINFCEVNYYIKLSDNFIYSNLIKDIIILENCLRAEFKRINIINLCKISNSLLSKHMIISELKNI